MFLLSHFKQWIKGPKVLKGKLSDRVCLVSALNDDFIEYFLVMLHSLKEHNPWFNHEVVILCNKKISPLSKKNRERIRSLYPRVHFREVDEKPYERFHRDAPKRLWPALLKLDVFLLEDYDRIVFIDSDIVCLGSIKELFTLKVPMAFCPAGRIRELKEKMAGSFRRKVGINSGVMVIGKEHLSERTHRKLLKLRSGPCADQDVLSRFCRRHRFYCLPHIYNEHAEFFWNDKHRDSNVRLLHYAGVKPLEKPDLPRMKPWFEARKKLMS
jgi:lipopolysaccharide biosynthesis glycosyltransferase